MSEKQTIKNVDCSHENTHLEVIEYCVTCEYVNEVCDDCGKVLRTLTDC